MCTMKVFVISNEPIRTGGSILKISNNDDDDIRNRSMKGTSSTSIHTGFSLCNAKCLSHTKKKNNKNVWLYQQQHMQTD